MARFHDAVSGLVADIDRRLVLAGADLTLARQGFARCPDARRRRACETAEAQVVV